MKPTLPDNFRKSFAIFLIAGCAHYPWAIGQNTSQSPADSRSSQEAACPTPAQVVPVHLYGLWRAEFDGLAPAATVLFEKHPELAGSVAGGVNRNGDKTLAAGDVDNGSFNLEESGNGQNITATWSGLVTEGSCGKEISGTWNNAINNTSHRFTLRKQPGWQ